MCLNEDVFRQVQTTATVQEMQACEWWTAVQTARLLLCHCMVHQAAELKNILAANLKCLYQLVGVDLSKCPYMKFCESFEHIYCGPRVGRKNAVDMSFDTPQEIVGKLKKLSFATVQQGFVFSQNAQVEKVRKRLGAAVYHMVATDSQKRNPDVAQYKNASLTNQ